MVFLIWALYYVYNMLEIIQSVVMTELTTSEGPTCIDHSTISQTAIQWWPLKHNGALKSIC